MPTIDSSSVTLHTDSIKVHWAGGVVSTLPNLWLRDNCSCDQCRFPQTTEKIFLVSSVPVDLKPVAVVVVNDQLQVTWPDGHESVYDADELIAVVSETASTWTSWDADFQPHRTDYQSFLTDDHVAADAIEQFLDHGTCILSHAPVVPGTLEELARRLGPVREVLFERIHNVEVYADGYNVAHTSLEVPPHNDFASYTWQPSVQALHMLANDTPGGESVIVDGWSVLQAYRAEQPELFDSLCTMPVPFRQFDENEETYAVEPLVRCNTDGEIISLRFSNQLMQAMNPEKPGVGLFYKAYHELCHRLTDPAAKVTFRLEAGEILLVAGHRVLHGRNAFEPIARRHLQDAYYELDNVKNHLVVLRRKNEGSM